MSSIFDPGRGDRRASGELAQDAVINGGQASGPGGISAGFNFSGGNTSANFGLGSFQGLLDQFQNLSTQGFNQAGSGLPPELAALGQNTIDQLGSNSLTNQSDFSGLGDIFQSSLSTAQADPFELGSGISAKLRALSERRNQRGVSSFFDRLKSTGNLTSSAGIQRAGDLERNLMEQGLQFDLAGLNAGQSIQRDAFGRALGASQGREAIGARQFSENQSSALSQFGVGSSLFDSFLRNQLQGANIAGQAGQNASATSQLPLLFLNALLGAGSQGSGSRLGAAGQLGENAQNAVSPFVEALNAAGQFASNIQDGG